MKPLALTIYPPVDDSPSWPEYRNWFRGRMAERDAAEAKRFTEAELCAEFEAARCDLMILTHTGNYWSSPFETCPTNESAVRNRADTMLRFATSPHYFEEAE